jgi:methylthioribose-1-phosphate isomerase
VKPIHAVEWSADATAVRIIDQRRLPAECTTLELRSAVEVREAIATLAVRGAPAIGVAAAMGVVAALMPFTGRDRAAFDLECDRAGHLIRTARPTAVNLAWAVNRVLAAGKATPGTPLAAHQAMRATASRILEEDREMCEAIGRNALEFLDGRSRVLTHCNAGALATAGIGTALAAVYVAHREGRRVSVVADETRPLLQGARLTAWELQRAGIPLTINADGMAAALMQRGDVDVVFVGADRIAANGDVANKIGTYSLAISAAHHGIPFVVCAPSSTIDIATPHGASIEIEERDPAELLALAGVPSAPRGVSAWNPAFDVTPAPFVSAIVTDSGVYRPPYRFQQ